MKRLSKNILVVIITGLLTVCFINKTWAQGSSSSVGYTLPKYEDPSRSSSNSFSLSSDAAAATDPFVGHKKSIDHYINQEDFNNPLDEWSGWASAYDGYARNTALFYSKTSDINKYRYPQVRKEDEGAGTGNLSDWDNSPASIQALNLGVDDEVRKLQMPVFQPIAGITDDFADDKISRDKYLDLYQKVRGIANLTLSYLDKTVAAGLATTQDQANAAVNQHLLKQISWATKELSNPRREQIFSDVDEKVEACMLEDEVNGTTLGERVGKIEDKCPEEACGKKSDVEKGKGLYQYCVCCAEAVNDVNKGTNNVSEKGYWSLVDRAFTGYEAPTSASGNSGAQDKKTAIGMIVQAARHFKEIYGDIIVGKKKNASDEDNVSYKYLYPLLSIDQYIAVIRDGCDGQHMGSTGSGSGSSCGLPGSELDATRAFEGICPSVWKILKVWPLSTDADRDEAKGYWADASVGKVLTAADINHWFVFSDTKPPVPDDWGPDGTGGYKNVNKKMIRFVESFCDASAVAALRKIHERTKGIMEDHLALNQALTEYQKAQIRELYNRFDRKFRQVNSELVAQQLVEEQLQLAAIADDRNAQGNNANNIFVTRDGIETPFSDFGGHNLGESGMVNNP